jgi:hypothetical protein
VEAVELEAGRELGRDPPAEALAQRLNEGAVGGEAPKRPRRRLDVIGLDEQAPTAVLDELGHPSEARRQATTAQA